MKKLLLLLSICVFCSSVSAQNPDLQTKLYYTCKVWGFAKYYHSRVSTCQVNWDTALIETLPLVINATTSAQFNDALDTLLKKAGPMATATTPAPATLPVELRRNLNFGWLADAALRTDVQNTLNDIKDNFRPHTGCYLDYTNYALTFPKDSVELNINTSVSYPDESHRLLALFKYWNILNYINPYNYVLDKPWDSALYNYVMPFDTASTAYSLYLQLEKLSAQLNDAHVDGLTYSQNYFAPPGFYLPGLCLRYIEGKYVVIRSKLTNIIPGDAIISIDGMTTQQWEDSLKQFVSAGSIEITRRNLCYNILARGYNATEALVVEDSTGTTHPYNVVCSYNPYAYNAFYYGDYYPVDSLTNIKWTTTRCNIGYVNMGNVTQAEAQDMYSDLENKDYIIFDIRNYPQGAAFPLAYYMYPNAKVFAKFTQVDVTYPGTFMWLNDTLGIDNNADPYRGKIIILMNEETQSHAEFSCMILEAMPNVVKIGSHTAGADGNVTYWKISQDLSVGFTGLGVFYPNGDSTQRIGIKPDIYIEPTRAGIRHKTDEVLDRALAEAGCFPNVVKTTGNDFNVSIYPNPANDVLNIDTRDLNEAFSLSICDIAGKTLLEKQVAGNGHNVVNIQSLSPGLYLINMKAGGAIKTIKFVKQ